MASVNKFMGIGNLTRDPELRYIPDGRPVLDLTLAVDGIPGEKGERTDFLPVTVWGKQAEACAKYLQKGSQIHVEGRVHQDRWDEEGQKRSKLEIVGDRITFLANIKKVEKGEAKVEPKTEAPADAPASV